MGVDEGVDDVLVAVDGSQVEGGVSLRTNARMYTYMHTCARVHTHSEGKDETR